MDPKLFSQSVASLCESALRGIGPDNSPDEVMAWGRAALVAFQYAARVNLAAEEAAMITFGNIRSERLFRSVNVKTFHPDGTVEQGKVGVM